MTMMKFSELYDQLYTMRMVFKNDLDFLETAGDSEKLALIESRDAGRLEVIDELLEWAHKKLVEKRSAHTETFEEFMLSLDEGEE